MQKHAKQTILRDAGFVPTEFNPELWAPVRFLRWTTEQATSYLAAVDKIIDNATNDDLMVVAVASLYCRTLQQSLEQPVHQGRDD